MATDGSTRRRRWTGVALLLLPVVGLACVPLYARDEPRLLEVPFFYWYQLAWVGLSMACMAGAAHLMPMNPRRTDNHGGHQ
jgi:hypothetical protein